MLSTPQRPPYCQHFLHFLKLDVSSSGPRRPRERRRHLRTLMSPLVNFFLEAQHTGEVDDPAPRGTRCCHFLSGIIFHHFHIRAFPRPLSAMKIRSRQIMTILESFFFKSAKFCVLHFGKGSSFSCWLCTSGAGSSCGRQTSKIGLFSGTP